MHPKSLRNAVELALKAIGYDRVVQLVPEFAAIDIVSDFDSESSKLASILSDENNVILKQEALLKYLLHFGVGGAQRDKSWYSTLEALLGMAEIRYASKDLSVGVVIATSDANSGVTVRSTMGRTSSEDDYIPLVNLALGNSDGPLKDSIEELTSNRLYRRDNRSTICTRYLHHILRLWATIFEFWTNLPTEELTLGRDIQAVPDSSERKHQIPHEPDAEEVARYEKKRRLLTEQADTTSKEGEPSTDFYTLPPAPDYWSSEVRRLLPNKQTYRIPRILSTIDVQTGYRWGLWQELYNLGPRVDMIEWDKTLRTQRNHPTFGLRSICTLTASKQHPFRPWAPCAPGLLLELQGLNDFKRSKSGQNIHSVFVHTNTKTWIYCGEYRFSEVNQRLPWGVLSSEEQDHWAKIAFQKRKHENIRTAFRHSDPSAALIRQGLQEGFLFVAAFTIECIGFREDIPRGLEEEVSRRASTVGSLDPLDVEF
ncbi:hypothetical protein FRC17_006407 [Serendipita sp. 399]|nr:hypothetical protein FRC17_006407 [Serendipita sp. 399]